MVVVASKRPDRVCELLVYQTLIVREARRCGGKDWLMYDRYFRQQVVGNAAADWSRLNASLYAVTFLAQAGRGRSCPLCMESDHMQEECALSHPKLPNPLKHPAVEAFESPCGKGRVKQACFTWNQGECRFQNCKYRHVCVKC